MQKARYVLWDLKMTSRSPEGPRTLLCKAITCSELYAESFCKLGLKTGYIPDSAMKASSDDLESSKGYDARLDRPYVPDVRYPGWIFSNEGKKKGFGAFGDQTKKHVLLNIFIFSIFCVCVDVLCSYLGPLSFLLVYSST